MLVRQPLPCVLPPLLEEFQGNSLLCYCCQDTPPGSAWIWGLCPDLLRELIFTSSVGWVEEEAGAHVGQSQEKGGFSAWFCSSGMEAHLLGFGEGPVALK